MISSRSSLSLTSFLTDDWNAFDASVLVVSDARPRREPTETERDWYVITSPNVGYIPKVYYGVAVVQARADGRFAQYDFTLWPQWCTQEFQHVSVIPRRIHDPGHRLAIAYWTPKGPDLEIDRNNAYQIDLGILKPSRIAQLRVLYHEAGDRVQKYRDFKPSSTCILTPFNAIRFLWSKLKSAPMTLPEAILQVAEFQRLYFDIVSFVDFYMIYAPRLLEPPSTKKGADPDLMGCITADAQTAHQMMLMRIPVWLSRRRKQLPPNMNILGITYEQPPTEWDVVSAHYRDPSDKEAPFDIIYFGDAGEGCARAVRRLGKRYPGLQINEDEPAPARIIPTPTSRLKQAPTNLTHYKPLAWDDFTFATFSGQAVMPHSASHQRMFV